MNAVRKCIMCGYPECFRKLILFFASTVGFLLYFIFQKSLPYSLVVSIVIQLLKSCLTLCDSMGFNKSGFPVLHYPPEFVQTNVH